MLFWQCSPVRLCTRRPPLESGNFAKCAQGQRVLIKSGYLVAESPRGQIAGPLMWQYGAHYRGRPS